MEVPHLIVNYILIQIKTNSVCFWSDDDQEDGPGEILFTSKNKKKKNKLDASLNKTETNGNYIYNLT